MTSYVTLCTTKSGVVRTSNTAAETLPGVGSIGAATTRVSSRKSGSTVSTTTTAKTATTSLLGGLVQADAITSTAKVSHSSKGYTRTGSSVFTNLTINGLPVSAKPAKNTTITIPGIATVLLNSQGSSTSSGSHALRVTALRVNLLDGSPLLLPAGRVVVATAAANLHSPTHRRPYGSAYGTKVDLLGVVKSGATAAVYLPCGGSSGVLRKNNVASASLGTALRVGAVKSAAKSTDSAKATVATTNNQVAGVRLLDDKITIDAVTTRASTTRKGSKVTSRSSAGTRVVGLKILGVSRSVSTKENTKISIAGIGTLYLHRAVRTSTGLHVYGVQLTLSTNQSGLLAGSTITVGSAQAGVAAR